MIQSVLESPPPKLSGEYFSTEFCDFLQSCLHKQPEDRASADALLQSPWLQRCGATSTFRIGLLILLLRESDAISVGCESAVANVHRWIQSMQ